MGVHEAATPGGDVGTEATCGGGLSGREEALRLLAWGYGTKEVAARLRVSVKTVETYKARGVKKLGLRLASTW